MGGQGGVGGLGRGLGTVRGGEGIAVPCTWGWGRWSVTLCPMEEGVTLCPIFGAGVFPPHPPHIL